MDQVFDSSVTGDLDRPLRLDETPTAVFADQEHNGSDSVRSLSIGENLFQDGDAKTHLYEIAVGVICVYQPRADGSEDVIEFAFPGDVLGLGYLDHHIYGARALTMARVKCLALSSLDCVAASDPRTKQRHAEALHREFAYRRELLGTANRRRPIGRVASFLLAVSQYNKHEGRDPDIITDALACGVVANWLKLDLESLRCALVELEKRELIEPCTAHGLRLLDLGRLQALAGCGAG